MKNLLVLFLLVAGFAMNDLQAQTTNACPPGCCKATCLPDGSCQTTDAAGKTVICTPAQMKSCAQTAAACTPAQTKACAQTAAACTPSPACKTAATAEAFNEKPAASAKLVASRQEK